MVDILDPLEKILGAVVAIKELVEIFKSKNEWFESCSRFMDSIIESIENYQKKKDPSKPIPAACGELLKELDVFRVFLEKEKNRSSLMAFWRGSSMIKEAQDIKKNIETYVINFTNALVVESLNYNKENFQKIFELQSKSATKSFKSKFQNEQAEEMWTHFFSNEDNVSWVDFGQALKKFAWENDKIDLSEAQIEVILATIDKDHNCLIQMEEWDLFYRTYWSKPQRQELLKSNIVKKSTFLIQPMILKITQVNSEIPQKYRYPVGHEFFISENQVEFINYELQKIKNVKKWDKEALIVGRDDPGRFRPDIYFPSQNTSVQKKQFQITLKKMIGSQGFFLNNLSISSPTSLKIENIPYIICSQMMFSLQETLFEVTEIDPEPSPNLNDDHPEYFLVNFLEKEEEDPIGNAITIKAPKKKKGRRPDAEEDIICKKTKKAPLSLPFIKLRIMEGANLKKEYEFHVENRKEEKTIHIGNKEINEIVLKEMEDMQIIVKWDPIFKQWIISSENKTNEAYLYLIKASDFHAKTIGKLAVKLRNKMTIAFEENEMEVIIS